MPDLTEKSLEPPVHETGASTRVERARERLGEVFDGKWRLDTLLGVGGSAAVYAATHRNTKRAAVKILHPELRDSPELVTRFLREGYVANRIDHPGALAILDDDTADDGSVYLVMELLYGRSLDKMGTWLGSSAALTLLDTLHVADDLLDVLAAAHAQGIVHRDIKPANLFMTTDRRLKVLDFGIARLAEAIGDGAATLPGMLVGTPAYMPPEQARGQWRRVDARSDVWATGATLFALLTGRRPRRAETGNEELYLAMTTAVDPVAQVEPRVPRAIADVVDNALSLEMDARWQDARAMQHALRVAKAALSPSDALGAAEPLAARPSPQAAAVGRAPGVTQATLVQPVPDVVADDAAAPRLPPSPPTQSTTQHAALSSARALPIKSPAEQVSRVLVGLVTAGAVFLVAGGIALHRFGGQRRVPAAQTAPPPASATAIAPPPSTTLAAPPLSVAALPSAVPVASTPLAGPSASVRAVAPARPPRKVLDQARDMMLSNPSGARELLEPRVARGEATRDEIDLLLTICRTLRDRTCVDACIMQLGLEDDLR